MCSCEAYYPSLNALMPRNKRTVNPQSPVLKSVRSDWVGLALVVGRNESYESGLCEALYYTGRCALKPEHSLCIDWCGQSSWNSLLHEQGVEAQSFFWRFCTIEGSYRAWGGSEYSVWSGLTALILVIFTRNCRIALGGWGSQASSTKVGNFKRGALMLWISWGYGIVTGRTQSTGTRNAKKVDNNVQEVVKYLEVVRWPRYGMTEDRYP